MGWRILSKYAANPHTPRYSVFIFEIRTNPSIHTTEETRRAPSLIARSPTFTKTQLMNPLFQKICAHLLTTRTWFWWGDKQKESISKPYVHSCTAIEIGPGGKAQPLHRDSYINHTILTEISEWDDERDKNRESAIGMMVAGCKVTKENGGTQFIPGSHLWYASFQLGRFLGLSINGLTTFVLGAQIAKHRRPSKTASFLSWIKATRSSSFLRYIMEVETTQPRISIVCPFPPS